MKRAIQTQIEQYNIMLREAIHSDREALGVVTNFLLNPAGKQMRPTLALLTAELHGGVNAKSYAAAMLFEILHWATLIHDDVIDEAYIRRGELTVGALVRSKSAVLIGDFLFSRGLGVAARADNFYAIVAATRTIEEVVEGELLQSEHAAKLDTTRDDYFKIISLKTGGLLASVAQAGAESAGATHEQIAQMYRLGQLLGSAFQIQDDLLDIDSSGSGKALYNDFRERKITLPLIYAIEQSGHRREALKHLRQAAKDHRSIEWLRHFIDQNGGIAHSRQVMNDMHRQAVEIVAAYPDSLVKESLITYCDYVVGRKI